VSETPKAAGFSFLRKVLITGWVLSAIAEAIAVGLYIVHNPICVVLFILGWALSCVAGIGTISAHTHHRN
jgi:hypothetical protein